MINRPCKGTSLVGPPWSHAPSITNMARVVWYPIACHGVMISHAGTPNLMSPMQDACTFLLHQVCILLVLIITAATSQMPDMHCRQVPGFMLQWKCFQILRYTLRPARLRPDERAEARTSSHCREKCRIGFRVRV